MFHFVDSALFFLPLIALWTQIGWFHTPALVESVVNMGAQTSLWWTILSPVETHPDMCMLGYTALQGLNNLRAVLCNSCLIHIPPIPWNNLLHLSHQLLFLIAAILTGGRVSFRVRTLMCACACACRCLWRLEDSIGSPGAGVAGYLWTTQCGAGDRKSVLWNSLKCSSPTAMPSLQPF